MLPLDPVRAPVGPVPATVESLTPKQELPTEGILASAEVPEPIANVAPDVSAVVTTVPTVAEVPAEPVIEQASLIPETTPSEVNVTDKPKRTNNGRKAKTEAA